MDPPKQGNKLEHQYQQEWIKYLSLRSWVVMPTHGNMFQRGFPDLLILHEDYGYRWVEIKRPDQFSFTAAQKKYFPIMHAANMRIYVLREVSHDEYGKLFKEPNWAAYMYGFIK